MMNATLSECAEIGWTYPLDKTTFGVTLDASLVVDLEGFATISVAEALLGRTVVENLDE